MTNGHKIGFVAVLIVLACSGVLVARGDTGAKGLAQATDHSEDRVALGVSWWYTWGENCNGQAGCIDMVRSMQLPVACYGYLLVGNEPNAIEPYGAPISPKDAAKKARAIELQCPKTRLVVGNVSADDWYPAGGWGSGYNWIKSFLIEYKALTKKPFSGIVGMHCYSQHTASYCKTQLGYMRSLYYGERWVTEFGIMDGDSIEFAALVDYIAAKFTRYSVYTNRQPAPPCDWCGPRTLDLVNSNGTLTTNGVYYSNK